MILLVVDTQKGCFNENLYLFETIKKNIKQLITLARENNVEVVYVQHDDGPGTDLDKSADNYEIYEEFAPRDGEKRFEKNVNSAFHPMTGLTEYLQSKGEKDIIAIGVSTDYCMDATVKSGFEKGFNIIIPEYTNSTYDNPYFDKEAAYHYFNDFMWNKRYAKVISFEQAVQLLQSKDFRVHMKDCAYITKQPRGIFTAVGKLVDSKMLTEEEENESLRDEIFVKCSCNRVL